MVFAYKPKFEAAILRSNTVHFFGALVHPSALLLVFQCTSALNTK